VPAEELRRGHQFKVHLELKEIKRSYLGIVAEAVGSCPSFCMISSYCMRRKRVFWGNMIAQSLRIPESVVEREFNCCGGSSFVWESVLVIKLSSSGSGKSSASVARLRGWPLTSFINNMYHITSTIFLYESISGFGFLVEQNNSEMIHHSANPGIIV